jgi:predicted N-acetyltransferase YhbS
MGLISDPSAVHPSARSKRIGLHRVFEGIETAARDDIGAGTGAFAFTGNAR